jgi:predicted RNA methylase
VRAVLPFVPLRGAVLEPGAGRGAIVRELLASAGRKPGRIDAIELDHERASALRETGVDVFCEDFLAPSDRGSYSLAIMNPPYALAMPFIEAAVACSDTVCALLRLGFLASQKRACWHRAHPCDVYVLPRRPSFTTDGKTDSADYAWMIWAPGRGGRIQVLECEITGASVAMRGAA